MYEQVDKSKENKSKAVAHSVAQKKSVMKQGFGFIDNRHEAVTYSKMRSQIQPESRGIVQKVDYSNSETELTFDVQLQNGLITAMCNDKNRGSLKYSSEEGHVNLLQIESHPEKGSGLGSLLIYLLASNVSSEVIKIPSATPDERGFYSHMGFSPDLEEAQKWADSEQISLDDAIAKYGNLINLIGSREVVLRQSETSFNKRWSKDKEEKKSGKQTKNSDKKCFITTACVEAYDKADDCWELTTLRQFRDTYMSNMLEGKNLIVEYYRIAPIILKHMRQESNYLDLIKGLYTELVMKSIKLIERGKKYEAMMHYKFVVRSLQSRFLND
jgi:hypothetical protein